MKTPRMVRQKVYSLVFVASAVIIILYIIISAKVFQLDKEKNIRPFSDGWISEKGESWFIKDARLNYFGKDIRLEKKLPDDITDEDSFCFELRNIWINIWVGDRQIYALRPVENLTGHGYGSNFCEVPLRASDAGKTIRLQYGALIENHNGARVLSAYISPATDYIQMCIMKRTIPSLISLLIVFLGAVMSVFYFRIPDKGSLPFDIFALGLMAVFLGIWLLIDTNIMPLLTGQIYIWRGLNRTVILMVLYPCVCFFNSLTELKRPVYNTVSFWLSFIVLGVYLALRFFAGIDMIWSFSWAIAVDMILLLVFMAVIFIDDMLYCRVHTGNRQIKRVYLGMAVLTACIVLDLLSYLLRFMIDRSYGTFTRIGLAFFITVLLLQFLDWWSRERAAGERDRFINRALQYAVASNSSEENIRALLEFMGTQLKTDRVCIFEERENGQFSGTYEWFREDLKSSGTELIYLPYKGYIEELYKIYNLNGRKFIVGDPEEIKNVLPAFYNLLKSNNAGNIVAGPLESNGRILGLLAFSGTPKELLEETSQIIDLLSFFITQLINQREEQKRLRFYSYNDSLSGALNRRAFSEFTENRLDTSAPFGYLVCGINDLEAVNRKGGYEAGDEMVVNTSDCLTAVFGMGRVYRLSGSVFAAFGFEFDETGFDQDVERLKQMAEDKGISISVGSVYCSYGTRNISMVLERANENMR